MLKQHKNALLEAIEEEGISPELFQAEETEALKEKKFLAWLNRLPIAMLNSPIFSISLKETSFKFSIWISKHDFDEFAYNYTMFKPGYPESMCYSAKGIDKLLSGFRGWLKSTIANYLRERDIPDLWTQIKWYKSFINESEITKESTADFSEDEKENLRNSVEKFKLLVQENFKPNKEQTEYIDEQLDYLSNALERLNRFDWRGLAISTVLSIAVNLSVDTEKGKLLFDLFQQAFQAIHKLLQ